MRQVEQNRVDSRSNTPPKELLSSHTTCAAPTLCCGIRRRHASRVRRHAVSPLAERNHNSGESFWGGGTYYGYDGRDRNITRGAGGAGGRGYGCGPASSRRLGCPLGADRPVSEPAVPVS